MIEIRFHTVLAVAAFGICACSENSNPSNSGPSGRIEAGLAGTWVENPPRFSRPDTLVFSESKIRTPFFSGTGTLFSAKDGLVKGGPDGVAYGEYLRFGDTLYFDALLGDAPNGVDTAAAGRYLRKNDAG
jgi:hypothetical protein